MYSLAYFLFFLSYCHSRIFIVFYYFENMVVQVMLSTEIWQKYIRINEIDRVQLTEFLSQNTYILPKYFQSKK